MKTPLNLMVFNDLYNKIKTREYKPGDALPTELEMEEIYGTSRAPIRQALGKLETEGLIVRKPGKGTFVTEKHISAPWATMFGFAGDVSSKWHLTVNNTLSVEAIPAHADIANLLSIEIDEMVVKTRRIRLYKNQPIFYLEHYLPNTDLEIVKSQGHIAVMRDFLSNVLGIDIVYVSEELSAVPAVGDVARELEVEEGYPLMEIRRVSYDDEFKPVEFVRYYVKNEDWKYRVMYRKEAKGTFL